MNLFTREEVKKLAASRNGPFVSILMPMQPASGGRQEPIRFKNLIREAREGLLASGMKRSEAGEFLGPVSDMLASGGPWEGAAGDQGLAVYLSRDIFRTYTVPIRLPQLAMVSDEFHLKPLLQLLHGDGEFYVLAVSQNRVRLLQCTKNLATLVETPQVPASLEEAVGEVRPKSLQIRTAASRPGGGHIGRTHGHGSVSDQHKDLLLDYFRQVDKGLRPALRGENAPMVLAGVDYYHPLYRQVNTYPYLLQEGVDGSPDDVPDEELRRRAWPLVEETFLRQRRTDEARYHNLMAAGLASRDLERIFDACCRGRVKVLFVAVGVQVWGRCDRQGCTMEVHEAREEGDKDLLNEVAILTLLHGGTVYALRPGDLPDGEAVVNAVFRW